MARTITLPNPSREHGERSGSVDLLDWDIAAWTTIGGLLDVEKEVLYMPLGFMTEKVNPDPACNDLVEVDRAKIMFKKPEPTHMEFDLPLIAISRDDLSPATDRIYPITEQYRIPAEGATRISACGNLGWSHYESRPQSEPYDFTYTYECWARDRTVAQMIFQILMARLPPLRGSMIVVDSIDCRRVYSFTQESTSDLTEVSSLVDRVPGFSVTIRVKGDLTFREPIISTAVTGPTQELPINSGDPDPGPGGLYAAGGINVTLEPTTVQSMIKRLHLGHIPFC